MGCPRYRVEFTPGAAPSFAPKNASHKLLEGESEQQADERLRKTKLSRARLEPGAVEVMRQKVVHASQLLAPSKRNNRGTNLFDAAGRKTTGPLAGFSSILFMGL